MIRADYELLGKVFAAEVSGRKIFQVSKQNKRIHSLAESGRVESCALNLGGRFPVRAEGWQLTHKGRIEYCEWASKQPMPDDPY